VADEQQPLPSLDSALKQMIAATSSLHPVFKKYNNPLVAASSLKDSYRATQSSMSRPEEQQHPINMIQATL
jgi:hypothetical protein